MTLRLMANPKPPKHPAWPGQHLLWCLPVTVTLFIFWEISLPRSQPVGFGRTVGLPPPLFSGTTQSKARPHNSLKEGEKECVHNTLQGDSVLVLGLEMSIRGDVCPMQLLRW